MRTANLVPPVVLTICCIGLGLTVAGCHLPAPTTSSVAARNSVGVTWPDECALLPGYAAFSARLQATVAARDAAGLRDLFAADGRMRMNGIGGVPGSTDWGLDRPAAAAVWAELDTLLGLGCTVRRGRAMLPFVASMTEDETGDGVIALRPLVVRSAPDWSSPAVQSVAKGVRLTLLTGPDDRGWAQVAVGEGGIGHVRYDQVRSPLGTVLVLVDEGGQWRIKWLGGNA